MSKLQIFTSQKMFPTAKNLYGIFFEDINRAGDGGLYPEMIRNRSFEDSIPPEDCHTEMNEYALVSEAGWRDQFNHGEGLSRWIKDQNLPDTPIPAWYGSRVVLELDRTDTLNECRSAALSVEFEPGGSIYNIGYAGMTLREGEEYSFYIYARTFEPVLIELSLEDQDGKAADMSLELKGSGYVRYDGSFSAGRDCREGRLTITCPKGGRIKIGYISLMPAKTYNGHGLRVDLVEKLKDLNPGFLRFPGGCIVEGFSPKTAMRFKNTVGPVWERPGHQLMWHYRSSDGLGFHEYLQLCEDLNMEPLYVFNCGMTCQGRNPVYFEGEEFEEMLQDTMNALEYALGTTDSRWGKLRAQMGHPAPFKMNYLEIGNENNGPEYEIRYKRCYDAIHRQYPNICFIANIHIEKQGIYTDIVDEHFYDTVEYFAENIGFYDEYDRNGPKVFIGELAVVRGWTGKLYAALGEAAFLIGAERNQDIVSLASYAPLLENVDYNAWFPNLIRFNQTESIGIPSYYVWKMFGHNRGEQVVVSKEESDVIYRPVRGAVSLIGSAGFRYRNARWNGEKLEISHELMGHSESNADEYLITAPDIQQREEAKKVFQGDLDKIFIVFGNEEVTEGVFDMDIFVENENEFSIGVYTSRIPEGVYVPDETNPPKSWNVGNVRPFLWKIEGKNSTLIEQTYPENKIMGQRCTVPIRFQAYNHFHYEVDGKMMRLFINGSLVHEVQVPNFPSFAAVVTDTYDEIIVKAVNLSSVQDDVEIVLDCDVEKEYEVDILTGDKDAENSFEFPDKIKDVTEKRDGASGCFRYMAPAYSVNIIRLKKSNKRNAG